MKIIYKSLDYQQQFHDSNKQKVYLSAGLGSGKTYSLVMKMLKLCSINQGMPGGLLAPSLKMFKRDVLPTINEICQKNNIPFKYNKSDSVFYFPNFNTQVYIFHSEDDGQSIRGPNLAWAVINEITLCSKNAFLSLVGRVRLKNAKLKQIAMSGSPESFNWCYEYFIENQRDDTELIFGDTRKNIYISPDYVKMLAESYDDLMYQQFVEGKFINLTGRRACYAFDRNKHIDKNIIRQDLLQIWISLDFNLYPMAATIWQRMPISSDHLLEGLQSIRINGSNTDEMCEVLKQKLRQYNYDYTQAVIFPDPAGQSGSTKSKGKSDIDILKQHGFIDIRYKRSISSVRDCLNTTNNLFNKNKIYVHTNCKDLIADMEQCIIKEGTMIIDKSDPMRTHWVDGMKDMLDYEFPIVVSRAGVTMQKIR